MIEGDVRKLDDITFLPEDWVFNDMDRVRALTSVGEHRGWSFSWVANYDPKTGAVAATMRGLFNDDLIAWEVPFSDIAFGVEVVCALNGVLVILDEVDAVLEPFYSRYLSSEQLRTYWGCNGRLYKCH